MKDHRYESLTSFNILRLSKQHH